MKFKYKKIAAALAMVTFLSSCSSDDTAPVAEGTHGSVELFFDNGVAGDALILGNTYTNSNGENLKINRLNYIVSNFVLVKEDGTEFIYPKEESYFIISQEANMLKVELKSIPAGNYKKIKFGIGVDQQRYLQGETAQQSFWDLAAAHNMTWTWSTGYRFINFEGGFTLASRSQHEDPGHGHGGNEENVEGMYAFQVHQGSNSNTDNYREVLLDLPTTARVRKGEMPNIHFVTDVNILLDGDHKIKLYDNLNAAGTSAAIMGGENLVKIADNSKKMFKVDHVHNGAGTHH